MDMEFHPINNIIIKYIVYFSQVKTLEGEKRNNSFGPLAYQKALLPTLLYFLDYKINLENSQHKDTKLKGNFLLNVCFKGVWYTKKSHIKKCFFLQR